MTTSFRPTSNNTAVQCIWFRWISYAVAVFEIFSLKDADIYIPTYTYMYIQTSTPTDNEECCSLQHTLSIDDWTTNQTGDDQMGDTLRSSGWQVGSIGALSGQEWAWEWMGEPLSIARPNQTRFTQRTIMLGYIHAVSLTVKFWVYVSNVFNSPWPVTPFQTRRKLPTIAVLIVSS